MANEKTDKKFTRVIKNFSSLPSNRIVSDIFIVGGCKWRLIAYPKGNNEPDHLPLWLYVAESESLPSEWKRNAKVGFTIVNQITEKLSRLEDSGYLVNDEIKIVTAVEVVEVIGQLDEYGFHVLPSQVKYVDSLFERHPDVATKVCEKNQYLKTGYMNVLLSLMETMRQSPMKISKGYLNDAYAALKSLTDVGFELDWLKKKLDQVSEKKEKEEDGESQIQKLLEELKDLKQKCFDVEAQLKKEKEDVLAAKVPVLLSWCSLLRIKKIK